MIDIQFIRDNADLVAEKAAQKGYPVDVFRLLELDKARIEQLQKVEILRTRRNEISSSMKGSKPAPELVAEGKKLKIELADLELKLESIESDWLLLLKSVPNMPTDDVPVGSSEDENVVAKTVGEPTKFDFAPLSHVELGAKWDLIDKERAAKIAGSRFTYIKGGLVRMQFAIMNWVAQTLSDEEFIATIVKENNLNISTKPFIPILPPPMIRTDVYEQTARLNGAEVTYKLEDDDLWLNASAEHSLCGMYKDETLPEDQFPIRYIGYATSFRREAGTYGKDMEGILRLHHFDKLEMEIFSTPETSFDEHMLCIAIEEYFMQQLGIPYRVLQKCTYDIGKPNARGVDIESWLPGQNAYRETHSADLITDYQTRRLKTRVKRKNGDIDFAHTNDATVFAFSRILIAIMENYQNADASITIPEVLRPFMNNKDRIPDLSKTAMLPGSARPDKNSFSSVTVSKDTSPADKTIFISAESDPDSQAISLKVE